MTRLALATLPPNVAFLDALAAWWLARASGAKDGGAKDGGDQDRIADGVFLVPTRRAARGLSDAFLRQAAGSPLLLPRIVALGGLDEAPLTLEGALDLPQAVAPMRRLAVLSRMILAMGGRNGAPATADRAWLLAADLANLLDEAARAEIDLAATLPLAVGQEFASHWNVTLEFLLIVTRFWPAWLAEEGLSDPTARQVALLNAQAQAWSRSPPAHPVIAAGTTGAIPAVARLLRVVAGLDAGQVVLPGLDLALDDASWDSLDDTHPQSSLRALLAGMGATRGDVTAWDDHPAVAPPARVAALRLALLPAHALGQWRDGPPPAPEGLQSLDAADQQEEAQAIALVLRGALDQPGARAALVTPDRGLAQRVTAELLRFGIVADDSAGEPLRDTPPAVFLRLLAVAAVERLRPVPLLALLKHPFCAAGLALAQCRAEARAMERVCLRGPAPAPGLAGLRLTKADTAFIDRLEYCLAPLAPFVSGLAPLAPLVSGLAPLVAGLPPRAAGAVTPDVMLRGLLAAAELLATTDTRPGAALLWQGEDGDALASQAACLLTAFADLPPQDSASLPGLLDAGLAGMAVSSRRALRGRDASEHPRIFIWGLLEARLQSADTIVLGGLAEGVWPALAEPGPWMNRAMRKLAKLPSPEEAVGLAAHDFVSCACAARQVILSAPKRRDRAPAVPSRWLARLNGLLAGSAQSLPAHPAPFWARALDRPIAAMPVPPPAPSPAVALRPRRLSVTEIETWLRDPYAIYAKHVLRLRKLKPLEESADAADYGRIVHEGLQLFHQRFGTAWPADANEQIAACMDQALGAAGMRPALAAWWRPRLLRIAAWVAEAEADRRGKYRLALIRSEQDGKWRFAAPAGDFTLTGRADRIERMIDGAIAILDYKTGTPPTQKAVEDGLAPQLPLEAAMVAAGAFGADLTGRAVDLTYWQISGNYAPGRVQQLFKGDASKVAEAADNAAAKLGGLVAAFDTPDRAYLSQPHPGSAPRFTDYAHLARVPEWASVDDDPPAGEI
jgi:ATP-dependent helicase/nuclease subunit B